MFWNRLLPAARAWRRRVVRLGACAVWCWAWAGPAQAQTLTLTIPGSNTFSFASADPDTSPTISSGTITVNYRVRNNAAGTWQITLLANGDFVSGGATIPISNVSWTASSPFVNGTLSNSVAQTLGSGSGNVDPAQQDTVVFILANSWSYSVGVYTQTVRITLTAP